MGHPVGNMPAVPSQVKITLKDGRELLLRGAERDDIPWLGGIYARVYDPANFDVGETWTPKTATQTLEDLDGKDPSLSLVAEMDGRIVGGILGGTKRWQGKNVLEIKEVFVNPGFQQRGIGKELMKECLHRARVFDKVKDIELVTFADRGHARFWYGELGFRPAEGLQTMYAKADEITNSLSPRSSAEGE
ncbi:MAG: GNAT family N-acetyltransferase [Candidatus Curtissbacteria bacterium]|nr:GNAT family N-acetyltransferase [Candidatus Curtissbacteria bacterium]